MIDISDFVNEPSPTSTLGDLRDYVFCSDELNPIDQFRKSLLEILNFGTEPTLNSNDFVGRLLLIGLVSAVEDYVRSMISSVVELCPIAQEKSAEKNVNLGSVVWHTTKRYSRSALEHSSLAEEKSLKNAIRDYLGIELAQADFGILIKEYEKTCNLRHGIVHSGGFLPGKNAIKLEIPKDNNPLIIIIRYRQLQDVANVLYGLVKSLNRLIFLTLCNRWLQEWRRRGDWNPSEEELLFGRIWSLCLCRSELSTRSGRSKITRSVCMKRVRTDAVLR